MNDESSYGICLVTAGLAGWLLVVGCRTATKKLSLGHDWRVPFLPIVMPGVMFGLTYTGMVLGLWSTYTADSISLGFAIGILCKILSSRVVSSSLKLTAKTEGVGPIEVWLDGENVLIGMARQKIADSVQTSPACIEIHNGHGDILDRDDSPLLPQLRNTNVDILGFVVAKCFVRVLAETTANLSPNDPIDDESTRAVIPYAYPITLNAVIDSQVYFIHAVDGYGAATPREYSDDSFICIRMRKWNPTTLQLDDSTSGVEHGDRVVLECDGKFMTIYRGWWIAWSSAEPRRSGAFRVEVLDEPPPRALKEAEESKLAKGLTSTSGMELRAQWNFRLRSVKFPEFELGVSPDKVVSGRAAQYIGLRKIADEGSSDNRWLRPAKFTAHL